MTNLEALDVLEDLAFEIEDIDEEVVRLADVKKYLYKVTHAVNVNKAVTKPEGTV